MRYFSVVLHCCNTYLVYINVVLIVLNVPHLGQTIDSHLMIYKQ